MTNPLEPLVAETWRDLEIAAGAKGQLAARMLHVPVENVRAILEDRRSLQGEVERLRDDAHSFKNFHRVLCERFDYTHDEKDWRRDQVSLIEWIAKRRAEKAEATRPEAVVVKGLPWAQNGRAEYSMWANVDHIDRCYTIEPNSNVFEVETRVFLSEYGSDSLGLHPTFEAAKAAAQADYERRILSAIELKPVAVAVTEAMRKAAAKEIGLAFQLHDLGRRNADGDFICTADQIDLLERLSNEAARSALEAALQSSVGAAGEPPAQPAGEGEADPSFADALPDEQIRIWINACNHEPARQALRQLLAYRVRGVSAPLKREMLTPQRFGLVADADGNAMWPVLAGEWVRYDDYVAALTTPQPPVAHVEGDGRDLAHQLADIARSLLSRPPELRGPFAVDEESLRRVAALPPRSSKPKVDVRQVVSTPPPPANAGEREAAFPPEDFALVASLIREHLDDRHSFRAVMSNNFSIILAALDYAASPIPAKEG